MKKALSLILVLLLTLSVLAGCGGTPATPDGSTPADGGSANADAGTDADYIVVELAKNLLGTNWMADYVSRANAGSIERVLL